MIEELEKKLLLTKEEYHFLMEKYGKNKAINMQINFYFDTDDLSMNSKGITCRIRLKDGVYKGTMKSHLPDADKSIEASIEVRKGIFDNGFVDMHLKYQGQLFTERCEIYKDSFCDIVLDKNHFLEGTDYELEIEYSSEHEKNAEYIFDGIINLLQQNVPQSSANSIDERRRKTASKSTRFFERRRNYDLDS